MFTKKRLCAVFFVLFCFFRFALCFLFLFTSCNMIIRGLLNTRTHSTSMLDVQIFIPSCDQWLGVFFHWNQTSMTSDPKGLMHHTAASDWILVPNFRILGRWLWTLTVNLAIKKFLVRSAHSLWETTSTFKVASILLLSHIWCWLWPSASPHYHVCTPVWVELLPHDWLQAVCGDTQSSILPKNVACKCEIIPLESHSIG